MNFVAGDPITLGGPRGRARRLLVLSDHRDLSGDGTFRDALGLEGTTEQRDA
jgi:hypothetical protein